MNLLGSSDPIFKKKKRLIWPYFILVGLAFYLGKLLTEEDPQALIIHNQTQAQKHIDDILVALAKWKRWDYDANGRTDFPLCDLKKLVDTQFVNGERLELISNKLALADLRNPNAVPIDGYFFTLTHFDKAWPSSGMAQEVQVLAVPAELGKSGSCSFYINTSKEGFFTNYKLDKKVPKWPERRQVEAGIWQALELD